MAYKEERLKKIHSKGYWRINIRPTHFEKTRIQSLNKCREIVEICKVGLRGWDYPHLDQEETANGQDWVESGCDWMSEIEYWRFYQSGQFIHHFACEEDYTIDPNKLPESIRTPSSSGHYLAILSTLYRITEIFEFAARLSSKGILFPAAEISISIHGTEGRQLFYWNRNRLLLAEYICKIPKITFQEMYPETELITRASEFAMDATIFVFERFNYVKVPRNFLAEDQSKLLKRKL